MTNALIKGRIEQFVKREGRRPRILVSNMGPDNHDHDTKLLAASFAESGFDVDISPLRQTPRRTARMAIENDVHFICFLRTENDPIGQVTDIVKALEAQQAENIKIIMGGAIPRSNCNYLYRAGVALILNSLPADTGEIHQLLDLFEK
jgi:methylmalonyl-CoA mutase